MTELVDPDHIEELVGARRHPTLHQGNVGPTTFILHSEECRSSAGDLRDCEYSLALDRGIDLLLFAGYNRRPVVLTISDDQLAPVPETCTNCGKGLYYDDDLQSWRHVETRYDACMITDRPQHRAHPIDATA